MLGLDRLDEQVDRVVIWNVAELGDDQFDDLEDWVAAGHVALVGGDLAELAANLGSGSTDVLIPGQSDTAQGPGHGEQRKPGPGASGNPALGQGSWGIAALGSGSGETAHPGAAHPITLGVEQVSVGPDRFLGGTEAYLTHLRGEDGQPVLVSWAVEKGRIYWSADLEWLANGRIAQAQNLDLALQILLPTPGKMVAFDEYHHGYNAASRWWQILRGPLQLFVVLLALTLGLVFWAFGARFGSPRPTPPGPPRAAVEYVYSMAQLYRRARARRAVLQALYRSLRQSLSRLLGGTQNLSHAEIAERSAPQLRVKPEVIAGLLNRVDPGQANVPTDAELIKLTRETEELQRRMTHAGHRDQRVAGEGSK